MSLASASSVPPAVAVEDTAVAVLPLLVEGDEGFLESVLEKLCLMSEEGAIKEGKAKGNSIFKLGTLKQIAKKRGLIIGLPKPEMIVALRGAVARAAEVKDIEASKRDGTYTMTCKHYHLPSDKGRSVTCRQFSNY
jgi:hypothetical protein